MSFDVFLQKFTRGQSVDTNREAVRTVLRQTTFTGPDDFGFYVVTLPDGVRVELSAKGLDGANAFTGCTFFIRGMSPGLVSFILDIARAGDMVILPAMEQFVPILSRPEQRDHLPQDLLESGPVPVLCESSAELESLLAGGYVGWKKYRDQIVNENRGV